MTKKILIVDDESVERSLIASSIKQTGYQVDQAASGLHALKKIYSGSL